MSEKDNDENMEGPAIRRVLEALPKEAILEALSAHNKSAPDEQGAAVQATLRAITHSQSFGSATSPASTSAIQCCPPRPSQPHCPDGGE